MTSLVLQPVRVQAALAGLLGLLAAILCGWWLVSAGRGSSALQRINLAPRSLPKLPAEGDKAQMLQHEREGLLTKKQTFDSEAKKQEKELARLNDEASRLQQQLQQAGSMTPEQRSVEAIKKKPPQWDLLKHEKAAKPEFDRLIVLWESVTDAAAEQEAIKILAANQSHWETEASTAVGNAANLRKKQAAELQTMKATFKTERDKKLASLRDKEISPAVADIILEAVKMLFTGDLRASPGENFTNSAGIELVWVPEGNFWIGKTEVSEKQYSFVIEGAAEGSDEPKEGVSFNTAVVYCKQLTTKEEAESALADSSIKLRPESTVYILPTIEQWNEARTSPQSTALEGFSNELHEWSSSTYEPQFSYPKPVTPISHWRPNSGSPVAIRHKENPISLPPTTTSRVIIQNFPDRPLWTGRLGFRVILIRSQGQP